MATNTLLTSGTSFSSGTSKVTASITPTNGDVVLVAVTTGGATPPQPTCTGLGATWDVVISLPWGNSDQRTTVFRARAATYTAGTLTLSTGATSQSGWWWSVVDFGGLDTTGTNGAGAIGNTNTGLVDTAAGTISVNDTIASANVGYGVFGTYGDNTTNTARTNWTSLATLGNSTDGWTVTQTRLSGGDTAGSMTLSPNSTHLAAIIIELKTPATGSVGTAAGTSTATAVGTTLSATGTAAGTSTAAAVGARTAAAVGTAAGTSSASAVVSRFPLSMVAGGRYLVDSLGRPFFMIGDACQSGACSPTNTDFHNYCDTRAAQGFNTININFIEHVYAPSVPQDRDGNFPFSTKVGGGSYTSTSQDPDWTSWVDAYWANLESKVAYARSKGILVSLAFYMGGGSQGGGHHTEGWYGELAADSSAHAAALGTYMVNGHGVFGGFGHLDNVIWTWGADLLFSTDTTTRDKLHAMAAAVRAAAPASHLFAGDWGIPGTGQGLSTSQPTFETFSDLQAVYAYTNNGNIITTSRNGYSYNPSTNTPDDGRALTSLPVYMKETGYEGESNPTGDAASVRKFGWLAILNGCTTGYWYGHRDVFNFAHPSGGGYGGAGLFPPYSDWDTSINSTGAHDMQRLAAFCAAQPMHRLVPSGTSAPFVGKVIVTGGNDSSAGGAVAASATAAGDVCLCYTPSTNFTVDMTIMKGQANAKWWDPTNGSFTVIGQFANTGTHAFTTPGTNSAGDSDWMLVLEAPFGTASGSSTATAVGTTAAASAAGTAAGTSTAAAVGAALAQRGPTAAGTSTVAAIGASIALALAAAAGIAAAVATGAASSAAAGSAAGSSTASAVGAALGAASGASAGVGAATAPGAPTGKGAGTAAGTSSAAATSGSACVGTAAGSSSAAAVGASTAASSASSAGIGAAAAVGAASSKAAGSAAGTSSATASSIAATLATGTAAGSSSASAPGITFGIGAGTAAGTSAASAPAKTLAVGTGSAAGSSTVFGIGPGFVPPPVATISRRTGGSLTSASSDDLRFSSRTK